MYGADDRTPTHGVGRLGHGDESERQRYVTLPADVRRRLDIEPGDKLRWRVDEDGQLEVEILRERYGAFEGAPTADLGNDSLDSYDEGGYEFELGDEE